MILGLLLTRCAPSMAQTSWSINAGTAALWLFSSALAPHTSATLAMMTSSEWPVSPRRNCPIVLQVLLSARWWKMLNYSECTWLEGGVTQKEKIGDTLYCPFYHRAQRQAAGGHRVPFTCGSSTNRGGVRPGLWGLQKCPHFLNNKTLLKTSLSTVISACGWSRGMKLSFCMVKSPGRWTKVLLCAESPQVCSPADISTQAVLWARAVAPLDSK